MALGVTLKGKQMPTGMTTARALVLGAFALVLALSPALQSEAFAKSIEGSWRGGGRAVGSDGRSYRIRCKIKISPSATNSFWVSGKCTSQKGTAAGSGVVKRRSAGRYFGKGKRLDPVWRRPCLDNPPEQQKDCPERPRQKGSHERFSAQIPIAQTRWSHPSSSVQYRSSRS